MEYKSIVAVGASSCFGKGDESGYGGFINRFKRAHEAKDPAFNNVYNLGVPGDTTTGMLLRMVNEAARRQPELVILSLGSNDSARIGSHQGPWVTTVEQFASNLLELIRQSKLIAKQVLVVTAYPIDSSKTAPFRDSGKFYDNQSLQRFVECSLSISKATATPVLDVWEIFSGCRYEEYLSSDGLHCSDRGHEVMADALLKFVEAL